MSFTLLGAGGPSGFSLKSDSWEPTLLGSTEGLEGFYCCCACLLPVEWRIIETSYPLLMVSGPVIIRSGEEPAPPEGTGDPSYIFYGMGALGVCCFTPPYQNYPGYMELQVRCENPLKPETTIDDWRAVDSWVTQYGEPVHCFDCNGYQEPCCPGTTGRIYPPIPPCCTTTTTTPPPTPPPPTTAPPSTTCPPFNCPPSPQPPICDPGCVPREIYQWFYDRCTNTRVRCVVAWYCDCGPPPPGPPPGPPGPPPPPPPGTQPPTTTTTTTIPPPSTTTTKPPGPGYPLSIDVDDLDFDID
jgi:hypothetical protein